MKVCGKERRDTGIAEVLSAEAEWCAWYRTILLDWFESRPAQFRFTGETLRQVALARGLTEPHHPNAWSGAASGLIRQWLREQKIVTTGHYVLATSPKTNAHALRQYEKVLSRRYRHAEDASQLVMEGL